MPDGFLLDVDTSKLREADNYFKSMISNAEKLQTALKGAFGDPKAFAVVNVLERVKSFVTEMGDTRLSPKVDTKRLEEFSSEMSNIVEMMRLMSQQQGIQFFDTKSVRDMEGNAIRIQKIIDAIDVDIKKKQEQYNNIQFKAPINPRTGNLFGKNTKAYATAVLAYGEEQDSVWREIKALEEKKKGYQEDLRLAKMTEDEKLQYVMKNIAKESAEKQKEINSQRARYKTLLSEQIDIQKKIEQAGKYGDLGEEGQKTLDEYNRQFEIRDKERRKIEEDYAVFVVDLTENAQRKMLDANLKRIKQEQEAKLFAYRTSAQGALEYAGKASTINEMKDAQKYLQMARGNVDVNDKTTIDQLNESYTRLRATIENLTTAEKNENSLQPTLRNEYARLLVELDKITAAQERMAKSSVYQSAKSKTGVTQMTEKELAVLKDEEALQKRLVDVQAKMNSIEKAAMPDLSKRIELEKELAGWIQTRVELGKKAGGKDISEARRGGGSQDAKDYLFAEEQVKKLQAQLDAIEHQESAIDDVKRKHDADRARESIALTEKTESQKAEIAKRKAREAYEEYKKSGVLSVDTAERLIGLTDNAKNAAQAEKAIKSLENAKKRLDKTDSRYEATIKDLNKAIAKHKQTIEQTKPVVEAVARLSAADALSNANNARTLQDLRQALKDLKQAREELDIENDSDTIKNISDAINDVNDKISEFEGKQKEVKQNNNDLKASFAGLKRLAIAWIGIEALKNYARKVVETRREFELLQKSLQTLLQDKNEANKIWQQTLDLALVSPFSVKELVSYTRQLAAYRIETELLHDRTKRLADVSAGLGVDMSRLILAYGQVRAASFLRATELRQFTEAGIPMLDELSKKLTEVEGHFVSVGDVMEKISKRKISFEDVDETFISMTSQGGMFYKVQEKQADTIHGMISNLQDAFDLMFNEIGKSNDSWIKGILKGITSVVKEWRRFSAEFTGLATGVVVGKLASSFVRIGKSIWDWYKGVKSVGFALKTISATGWGAIIGALASIAVYIHQISQETDELNRKFIEIDNELTQDLTEAENKYKELASTIRSVTKSYTEKNEALEEMKRLYGDILPDEMVQEEHIKKMADGYKKATDALKEYYNAQAREQKQAAIESSFNEKFSEKVDYLYEGVTRLINYRNEGVGATSFLNFFGADENTVRSIIGSIINDMKEGAVSVDSFYSTLVERVAKYYGKEGLIAKAMDESVVTGTMFLEDSTNSIKKYIEEYNRNMANVRGLPYENVFQENAKRKLDELKKEYQKQLDIVDDLDTALSNLYDAIKQNAPDEKIEEAGYEVAKLYQTLGQEVPKNLFDGILNSAFNVTQEIQRVNIAVREAFKGDNKRDSKYGANIVRQMLEDVDKENFEKAGGKLRNTIESIMEKVAGDENLRFFDKLLINDKTSLDDYIKTVEEHLSSIVEKVNAYKLALEAAFDDDTKRWVEDLYGGKEAMSEAEQSIPVLQTFLELLRGQKTKKQGGGNDKDWWLEMVSGLKNLHSEFLTLRKDLDATEARALALEKFKGVFDEILSELGESGKSINIGSLNFETEEGMIDAFTTLKNMSGLSKEARLAIEKALTDIRGEIRLTTKAEADESLINTIEGMFSDYELSLELEKLNIPPDLAQSLFGVDTMSLKELRSQVESLRPQFVGTDMEKEYEAYLKKISEMEEKEQLERLKKYSQYLVKGMNERVKIKVEELRQIKEVEGESKFTPEQRTDILSKIRKETQGKLDKQEWEDFKGSSMYTMVFQDLESYGDKTIGMISAKLQELKSSLSNLDPTQVKEIVAQIEKIEKIQIERNPFKMLSQTLKEVKTLRSVSDLEKDLVSAESIKTDASAELKVIQDIQAAKHVGVSLDKIAAQIGEENRGLVYETNEQLQSRATYLQAIVAKQDENIQQTTDDLGKHKKLANVYKAAAQETQMWQQKVNEMFGSIKGVMTAAGVEADSTEMVLVDAAQSMVDLVFQAVAFQLQLKAVEAAAVEAQVAMNSMLGPIGWVVLALQAVATLLSSILGQGDKKKEKQIVALTEKVKDLERAYQNLEKATQASYNIDTINSGYDAMKSNLQEQIAATEEMIRLEEDKKDTDHGKIADWKREIEDMEATLKELEDERINQLGGVAGADAYLATSQAFVDAWIDAFRETGDGLSGLEEQFDEVYMNLVKKQVLGRGVDKMLEPLYQSLDGMLNDGAMDAQEFENFTTQWNALSPQINEFLNKVVNDLGIADDITKKTGELSGLQEGISGITEDQADILAAYWSSVRFIVSNIEQRFTEYANRMSSADVNVNPILGELRAQTLLLQNIDLTLSSIIGRGNTGASFSGAYVKVVM